MIKATATQRKRPQNSGTVLSAEHAHRNEARQAKRQRFQTITSPMSPVPSRAPSAADEQGPHAPAAMHAPRLGTQHAGHAGAIQPFLYLCGLLIVHSLGHFTIITRLLRQDYLRGEGEVDGG